MPEKQETSVAPDTVKWLQDEAHKARAQLSKLEQQVEQLQALFSELSDRARHFDEAIAALGAQTAAIASVQEGMLEARATAARIREEQEKARARLLDVGLVLAEVARSVEQIERQVASSVERQAFVDDAMQRQQQAAAESERRINTLEQEIEEFKTRVGRATEAVNRLEQRLPELDSTLEAVGRANESQNERVRLVSEVVRRLEGELDKQKRQAESLTALVEGLELQRLQRQRLEARTSQLDEAINGLRAQVEEQQRLLSAVEGKHHGYEGRLDALNERLDEYRRQLADYLLRLTQSQEQLKRRQIDDLEREIKELEQYALNLFGE